MSLFSSNRKPEPVVPPATETPPQRATVAPQPASPPAPTASAPVPAARASGGFLSQGVSINGSVKFRNALIIDGEVEGKIDSAGSLTVGKNARIRGEVRTKSVTVEGSLDGNIFAEERCELRAGSVVRGDIESPRLVVDEEATFIGGAKITSQQK
jgi:cytoskeletal protein CcmA (bactofilin family)